MSSYFMPPNDLSLDDDLKEKINAINISNSAVGVGAVGSAGGSGAVGNTYAGYVPGYGPTPSIVNGLATPTFYSGTTQPATIYVNGEDPTLKTEKVSINLNELGEMMKIMRERLLILVPDFEKHEKYEALKKAYDHYKLIEAMIMEKKDDSGR